MSCAMCSVLELRVHDLYKGLGWSAVMTSLPEFTYIFIQIVKTYFFFKAQPQCVTAGVVKRLGTHF